MHTEKRIVLPILLALVIFNAFCVTYQSCNAQETTADIEGKITGEKNQPLANVNVILKNQETGLMRGAVSSHNGRYRIPTLEPGMYEITARHIGYAVEIRKDIILSVGQVTSINYQLIPEVLAAADTLVVFAKAPLIETTESDLGIVVDDIEIRNLPFNSRSVVELALLSPGVTRENDRPFSPVIFGANNCRGTFVFLDGIDVSREITGGTIGQVSQNSIDQFEVITSRFKAEYGNTAAGIINLISKSGTNEFHGDLFGLFTDDVLNERNHFAAEKSQYERQQFGFTFGGPIIKDKSHFFLACERSRENNYSIINTNGVFPKEEGKVSAPNEMSNYFVKLNHQLSSSQWLMINLNVSKYSEDNLFIGGINTQSTGEDIEVKWHVGSILYKWIISDRLLNEARFGFVNSEVDLYPASSDPFLKFPSYATGRHPSGRQMVDELNFHFRDDLSFHVPDMLGEHNWKFGVDMQQINLHINLGLYNSGMFVFPTDTSMAPLIGLIGDGNSDFGNLLNTRLAFYVQDDWSPVENLTFNLGLRYDIASNATNQDYVSTKIDPDLPYIVKADRPVDKNNIAPRLGFAWDPLRDGKIVIRGGYGIYFGQIISDITFGEIRSDNYRIYNVLNPGTTNKAEIDLETLPYQIDGLLPEEVSNPYSNQFSIGLSKQLTDNFAVDIDYNGSRGFNHIFARHDINPVDPTMKTRPMPQYNEVYVARTTGKSFYDALQVVLRKRSSHHYQFRASYTFAKAENDFDDEFFVAPGSFLRGPAAWDERHRFQLNGQVLMLFGIQLSGIVTLSSGRPYNINTGTDENLNGNLGDDFQPGKGRNSERADGYASVDLRMSKFIHFGKYKLELISEAFNLFNHVNYAASSYVGNPNSPSYGQPMIALAPRRIQVGTRISF